MASLVWTDGARVVRCTRVRFMEIKGAYRARPRMRRLARQVGGGRVDVGDRGTAALSLWKNNMASSRVESKNASIVSMVAPSG